MDRKLLGKCLKDVYNTKSGKQLLWHILSLSDVYAISADTTLFVEGRRSVGVDLLQLFNDVDPTMYGRLLLEDLDGRASGSNNDRRDDKSSGRNPGDKHNDRGYDPTK